MMKRLLILLIVGMATAFPVKSEDAPATNLTAAQIENRLSQIRLPEGFHISLYAMIPNARSLAVADDGTVFVGTRRGSSVQAVRDTNGDFIADETYTIGSGLNVPNGVALHNGDLYVAEISRILRYDDILNNLATPPAPVVINNQFPTETHHGWKYIAFGPDGKLYVPVGAPCNVCEVDESRYAIITRMNPDGSAWEVVARGIRNTVGFTWHPETNELWFTDNGRDDMGDNLPPDELNHAPQMGLHFGFPYCHAGIYPDPNIGSSRDCPEFTAPAKVLGPHVAALGLKFYTGDLFPPEYHHQIFIAEHGSWNRTEPIGYRVSLVRFREDSDRLDYEVFADGWLQADGSAWGRPVDVAILADGSMLVSDDTAGAIYRISYLGQ